MFPIMPLMHLELQVYSKPNLIGLLTTRPLRVIVTPNEGGFGAFGRIELRPGCHVGLA